MLPLVLLSGSTLHAQEALRTYLNIEPQVEPLPESFSLAESDRSHLGPLDFTLGTFFTVEFDNNINLVEKDPLSDVIFGAGIDLGLSWEATENSTLRLRTQIGYSKYLRHSSYDSWELSPDSALAWTVNFTDGDLTFFDQFSYTRQAITEAAVTGTAILPRFNNTVGARVRWLPNQWLLEATISHSDYLSDSTAYEYLNRSSQLGVVRAGWRFTEDTQAGLEGSAGITDYRLATQPDNQSYSVGPYAEWHVTKAVQTTIRGGPTFYNFESDASSANSELGSYYLSFDVRHQITDFIDHSIVIARDVRLGINEGSKFTEQLTANYAVHWAATHYCSARLNLIYEHGTQPFEIPVPATERFDRYGLNPSVSYQLTDKSFLTLQYWYWHRVSNFDNAGYRAQSVTLGFSIAL